MKMKIERLLLVGYVTFLFIINLGLSTAPVEEGRNYALLIAVNEYTGDVWKPLRHSVEDAEALRQLLNEKYDFEQIETLYNETATRKAIIDKLDEITAKLGTEDNLLIFFSGHGVQVGSEGYWVPKDATTAERSGLVPNSEIKTTLLKTYGKHILILADAFFSNAIFRTSDLRIPNDGTEAYYNKVDNLLSRQAIISGSVEPVKDRTEGHSVFSKYLLKFLKSNQKPKLTARELFELIKIPIEANSPFSPEFGHIHATGHEGGQFIFRLKPEQVCNIKIDVKGGNRLNLPEEGGVIQIKTNAQNANYEWVKNISPIGDNQPSLKVTESGEYTVVVTDEDNCSNAATIIVNVELPQIFVTIEEGSEVQFTHRGILHAKANSDKVVYEWRKNNYLLGTGETFEVKESGIYTVSVKTKTGRVISTTTTNVTIKPRIYKVKEGDDLAGIAKKFYGQDKKAYLIENANPSLKQQNSLKIGIELIIPADSGDKLSATGVINLVGNGSIAPFSGQLAHQNGMMTEVIKEVFKTMNEKISIDFLSWDRIKATTFNGRFTAAYPCMKNKKDELRFHFSAPLYTVLNVFFIKKDANIKYKRPKDLRGKMVGLVRGASIEGLDALYSESGIKIKYFGSMLDCFSALSKGAIDLIAAPQMVGWATINSEKNLNSGDFTMLEKEISTTTLHLLVSKKYPRAIQLVHQFNTTFATLKKKGVIEKIVDKHIDLFQKARP